MDGNENNEPDVMNEDWIFSAETKHCETGEVALTVCIITVEERERLPEISSWLQNFVETTQTIPMRFTISDIHGEVIAQGQAGVE
jgi:hypothetical protein